MRRGVSDFMESATLNIGVDAGRQPCCRIRDRRSGRHRERFQWHLHGVRRRLLQPVRSLIPHRMRRLGERRVRSGRVRKSICREEDSSSPRARRGENGNFHADACRSSGGERRMTLIGTLLPTADLPGAGFLASGPATRKAQSPIHLDLSSSAVNDRRGSENPAIAADGIKDDAQHRFRRSSSMSTPSPTAKVDARRPSRCPLLSKKLYRATFSDASPGRKFSFDRNTMRDNFDLGLPAVPGLSQPGRFGTTGERHSPF